MRILCVSDAVVPMLYHDFDRRHLGVVDAVISCGDLPPEYLTFLREELEVPLFYIKGNHDIRYAASPPKGCINIHRRIVRIEGLRILGLEGSRWYNGGPFQYTEAQMRWMIWKLKPDIWWKKGIDIVVTHAPPRYVHDKEDLCHRGFKSFRHIIHRHHPPYFLHGHIHQSFTDDRERMSTENTTIIINCFGHFFLDTNEK
ncbi:MAG: metallophosphoesterase [Desulfobacteraceae bacterium]|nr:metallophosphoesterase [Desulfobacteraceae bacterium]